MFFEGVIRHIEQFRLEQTSASNENPPLCAESLSEQAWDLHLPVHPETCLACSLRSGARVHPTSRSFILPYLCPVTGSQRPDIAQSMIMFRKAN